ncbi:hypothetical protein OROMI_017936 [Orobanche minor]
MAAALNGLGTGVRLEDDIYQGVAHYNKALYYNWHYADAMYNLGVAYGEMLRLDIVIENRTIVQICAFLSYYAKSRRHIWHRTLVGDI